MKKLFFLILIISSYLTGNNVVPEKLLMASKAFLENPNLYPIHRIDLIIFSYNDIKETNNEESFSKLEKLIYSNDLIILSESSHLLVVDQAIKEGLAPSNQVIRSIRFNDRKETRLETEEPEENKDVDSIIDKSFLPYEYFVLLEDKNTQTKKLVKKLNNEKEYEVLFQGNWFQPLFNKEFASPVYIHADNLLNGIHGELLVYKEKFLHSEVILRLADKSYGEEDRESIILYNFNNLLKISKVNNKFINFFKSIGEEVSSFSNWIFRSKEFSPVTSYNENNPLEREAYKDKYEINQKTKMKDNVFHYIDHPYFGIVLRVSLWKRNEEENF